MTTKIAHMPRVLEPGERGGYRCPSCFHLASTSTVEVLHRLMSVICSKCRDTYDIDSAEIHVLRSCEDLLTDVDQIFSRKWYHSTGSETWHSDVLNNSLIPLVHIGTYHAAIDRAKMVTGGHMRGRWLYRLAIDADALVHPEIFSDHNDLDGFVGTALYDGYDVIRYVNRWESPGSVSLLINPSFFTVLDQRPIVW